MLSIKNLQVAWRDNAILQDVSLSIRPGEFVVVLGRNGAGKSTLLKALAGDFALRGKTGAAYRADLSINGESVDGMDSKRLARLRAVYSQSTANNYPLHAAQLVRLGRYPHVDAGAPEGPRFVEDVVSHALTLAGAARLAERDVTTLSGGEYARVQFARALAQVWPSASGHSQQHAAPRYLLLDEPTAALDLVHQHSLFSTVARLTREWHLGALAISHDCTLAARYADRLVLLADGKIVAAGTAADVMHADLLEQCYGVKVEILRDPNHGGVLVVPSEQSTAAVNSTSFPT
ncbi:heme ABC transporter ATP-binding protein [Paraburkholderia terrae]|uniref:ATP-binding cassette domain-containing protein n=1 Tax=Paraburkholderia terrae TaxID=311230 RepID=UPI0030DE0062